MPPYQSEAPLGCTKKITTQAIHIYSPIHHLNFSIASAASGGMFVCVLPYVLPLPSGNLLQFAIENGSLVCGFSHS